MKRLLLGIAGLTLTMQSFSQTFTESASSFGLGIVANKDGGLCLGDFNEDGVLDVVVNTTDASIRSVLLFSNGIGSYTDVTDSHANALNATSKERSAVVGDFNRDGLLDFVVADFNRIEIWLNQGAAATPAYAFGDASQNPNQSIINLTGGINAEGVVTVDYDNDGDLDLIVDNQSFGVDVLANNGSGVFTQVDNSTTGLPTAGTFGDFSAAGDYDNDGFVDVLVRRSADLSLYHNNGDGTFTGVTSFTATANNANKGSAIFADFDNDQDLDILWSDQGTNQIWRNDGVGGWVATGIPTVSGNPIPNGIDGLSAADVDNDGDLDFYMGNGNGPGFLFINTNPSALTFTRDNLGINPNGNTEGLSFVDIDNDGDQDLYINIDSPIPNGNQLWINDLNDGNFLLVDAKWDNGTSTSMANGATAVLLDCDGTAVSGLKSLGAGEGHGCFGAPRIHFGVADPNATYFLRVFFPNENGTRSVVTKEIVPSALAGNTIVVLNTESSDAFSCPGVATANDDSYTVNLGDILADDVSTNDTESQGAPLTFNLVDAGTAGTGGTFAFNTNGTFTFDANTIAGTYTFTYEACNAFACDQAVATIVVTAVNTAPVANDDSFVTDEDTTLSDTVAANDSDPESDALVFNLLSTTTNGVLTFNADGTFGYVPNSNFNGLDVFTYEACDAEFCTAAQVEITVNAVNDNTVGSADSYTTDMDVAITDNVLTNDTDADGDILFVGANTTPSHGLLSIDLDGTFTYTPNAGYTGTDSFTYDACDGFGPCASVVVSIQVNAVITNTPPTATDDSFGTNEDTDLSADVATNDSDAEGDALTYVLTSVPGNGTVVLNADGTFLYTPDANFSGNDSFIYDVCDAEFCSSATVSIAVNAVNDNVVANDDAYTTDMEVVVSDNVLTNDTDVDADVLSVGANTNPTNGLLLMNSDGSFVYTPNASFVGTDSFTYEACDGVGPCATATVTITVNSTNTPPVAADDSFVTDEDLALNGDVTAGDSDPEGDVLTFQTLSLPANGVLAFNADGTFTYTPDADFNGLDVFVYEACDAEFCTSAQVEITISPVNDAVVGIDDNYSTLVNTDVADNVLTNDTDIDGDLIFVGTNTDPSNGTLILDLDGAFTYTPNTGFVGTDSFTYEACDGFGPCSLATVTIVVTSNNTAPIAEDDFFATDEDTDLVETVIGNDSDAEGDVLSYTLLNATAFGTLVLDATGSFTYTPNANFHGTDTFTYEACDAFECASASVTIEVLPVNDAPVATDDVYNTNIDVAVTDNVLVNDEDIDGDVLVIGGNTLPANGLLSLDSDGTFTYIPNTGFVGTDSFTYEACDGVAPCATATVTINVASGNTAPVAADDSFSVNEDNILNADVSTNDSDAEGDVLTYTLLNDAVQGEVLFSNNGSFVYTPFPDFFGTDSFVYEVCDGDACSQATATIDVVAVNDAPLASDDNFTTNRNETLFDLVNLNDVDVDGDPLQYSLVTTTANGTLVLGADGLFEYTPNLDFVGFDSFVYEVCDNGLLCASATATIEVLQNNLPPVAEDDAYIINEDQVFSNDVSTNDLDPESQPLTFNVTTFPSFGDLLFNADGTFTYTPNANYFGTDFFVYEACDDLQCEGAGVSFFIQSVQDAPVAQDDNYTTGLDEPLTANALDNDSDIDGDVLTVVNNTLPSNGTLSIDADGTFTYIPNPGFLGADSFEYQVCDAAVLCQTATVNINVVGSNLAPTPEDDFYTTNEDEVLADNVGVNDTDPNDDALTYALVLSTQFGVLEFNSDGTFTYTPDADFFGTDFFVYEACDAELCESAGVTIEVLAVNDAPVANDDNYTTGVDQPITENVLVNDTDIDGDILFVSANTDPSNGIVSVDTDGTFTYIPNPGFVGADSFTYTVCDGVNPCATATVNINVTGENTPPVAEDDFFTIFEDLDLINTVAANDSDPENNPLTFNLLSGVTNGTLQLNADGSFTYIPNAEYSGFDSFEYEACDGEFCTAAGVTIEILPLNDAPIAVEDFYVSDGSPITENVVVNDIDADNETLVVTANTDPSNGTVSVDTDGTFTYIPNPGFSGQDTFTYTVCDSQGDCATTTVYINVVLANQPPIAVDDQYTLDEDTSISGNVTLNDIDPEGLELLATLLDSTNRGVVSFTSQGSFTYTPNPNYRGQDTLIYQVCDPFGLCDTAIAVFTVLPIYDEVIAIDDNYTINEDQVLTSNVRGNDPNPDGGPLVYSVVNGVTTGTLVFQANGSFTYTPPAEWSGVDTFEYKVCDATGYCDQAIVTITVLIVNDAPVAGDDTFTVDEDAVLNADVSTNDSDIDSPVLTYAVNTDPANGTATMNADGTFVYTPNANYNGTDTFTYEVCDEGGNCVIATVTIVVNPMYDAAVAVNDVYTVVEDGVLANNVGNNDENIDGGPLTFTLVVDVSNGTLVLNGDGTFVYTPDANYVGGDEFVYQMCDAAGTCSNANVQITVTPVNDAPVANDDAFEVAEDNILSTTVADNDSDVENDDLSFTIVTNTTNGTVVMNADGTFTYTPNADYNGADTFTYSVCDASGDCDEATVLINVSPVPDAPVAEDDNYSVVTGDALNADVSVNDTDVDGDPLTFTLVFDVTNGVLVFNPDGTFTYTPTPGYIGPDNFTYQACDPIGLCDNATVFIDVLEDNIPPLAVDDEFATDEDTQLNASVATNDSDVDDTVLTYTVQSTTTNGVLILNADGTFVYNPDADFNGTDSFVYLVCDPSGACDEAVVTITVNPVNDAPVANDDTYFVTEDFVLNGNVQDNDTDVENDVLTITLVTDVTNGVLVLNADGTFTYTPNADFNGNDSFVYEACDGSGACDQATVNITVTPVPDAPFAEDDTYVTFVNVPVTGNVGDNDTDPEGGVLTFNIVSVTVNGTWVLNADGTFTYTPNPGFFGVDTGVYQVCDSDGLCDQATVTFNVTDGIACDDDAFDVLEDNVLNETVAGNDSPDLTYTLVNTVSNGTLVFNADGTFTYTPNANFNGTDTFVYQGCNDAGICDEATVTINVVPVNDAPVDGDETAVICEDATLTIAVLDNTSDIDNVNLSVTSVSASVGTASYDGNGNITFTPPAGFVGTAVIGYQVCDDAAVIVCDPSEVTVTIASNTFEVVSEVVNASCFGRNDGSISVVAIGGIGDLVYTWSNQATGASNTDLPAGDYTLTITDVAGCATSENLSYIITSPSEIVVNMAVDFDPCVDKTANIDVTVSGGVPAYIYIWADGNVSTEDRVGIAPGATYSLTVGDAQGCTVTKEVAIDDSQEDCFRVPDGFSPDGDGVNDNLVIRGIDNYPGNNVKIFNRWGNLVFEATNYDNTWNGLANTGGVVVGERVQAGTYFYVIDLNNNDEPVSGYIIIKY